MILSHYTIPAALLKEALERLKKSAPDHDGDDLCGRMQSVIQEQNTAARRGQGENAACPLTAEEASQKEQLLQEIKMRVTRLKLKE